MAAPPLSGSRAEGIVHAAVVKARSPHRCKKAKSLDDS